MSIEIYGRKFKNILEYMENENMCVPFDEFFKTSEEIDEGKKYGFRGIYTYTLIFSKYKRKSYEFVFVDKYYDERLKEIMLDLRPIKIKDLDLFNYMIGFDEEPSDKPKDNVWIETNYCAYREKAYSTGYKELVDYDGVVRRMFVGEHIGVDNGINYKIDSLDEEICFSIKELKRIGLWDEMKKDNFMGYLMSSCVYNTGEISSEHYFIVGQNDENIICITDSARNVDNMPLCIKIECPDGKYYYKMVRINFNLEYIPYSVEESL